MLRATAPWDSAISITLLLLRWTQSRVARNVSQFGILTRTMEMARKQSLRTIRRLRLHPFINFSRAEHVDAAERALKKLVELKPDLLLVSAGFDAYAGDPLVQMMLEQEDFAKFGDWLRETGIATAAILEGGYSDELPELIDAFLSAWEG